MPPRIRFFGRYGNGAVALMFGMITLIMPFSGDGGSGLGVAIFTALVTAMAVFNIYVIEKSAQAMSEERWLESEIHKIELRKKLASLREAEGHATPDAPP